MDESISSAYDYYDCIDLLEQVDIDTIAPEDRRCPHCWSDFGVEEGFFDEPEESDNLLNFRQLPFCATTPNNDPVRTPCGHVFGRSCLAESLRTSTNRPMCRCDLTEKLQMLKSRHFYQNLKAMVKKGCSWKAIRKSGWDSLGLCHHRLVIFPVTMLCYFAEAWLKETSYQRLPWDLRLDAMFVKFRSLLWQFLVYPEHMMIVPRHQCRIPMFCKFFTDKLMAEFSEASSPTSLVRECMRWSIEFMFRRAALEQRFMSVSDCVAHEMDGIEAAMELFEKAPELQDALRIVQLVLKNVLGQFKDPSCLLDDLATRTNPLEDAP